MNISIIPRADVHMGNFIIICNYSLLFYLPSLPSLFMNSSLIICKYSLKFTNKKHSFNTFHLVPLKQDWKTNQNKSHCKQKTPQEILHVFALSPLATYVACRVASFSFHSLPRVQKTITRL